MIRGCGAISALGIDAQSAAQAYLSGKPSFSVIQHQEQATPVAALSETGESALRKLQTDNPSYRQLDRSVLLAIFAARQATEQARWLHPLSGTQEELAVNIGSSRGATGLFEQHFEDFQQQKLSSSASPTTTLGNLSSWVGHAVHAGGAQISHSITCSTALMAVANGVAWLRAGMARRFLAGGTEAPLTDFTIAQMKAIGIYSAMHDQLYPCQPYGISGQNTFVLGEGAAVLALEKTPASQLSKGDVIIEATGFGFEQIKSKTGISDEGLNFQQSMRHALSQLSFQKQAVDVIITHSPGTRAGDKAELNAIKALFEKNLPAITTNKHLLGHTLGASGALSLQYALLLFTQQQISIPGYTSTLPSQPVSCINRIMINAAGFGGNSASIILSLV